MKRLLYLFILVSLLFCNTAFAQNYKKEGDNFVQLTQSKQKQVKETTFTYTDTKGNEYKIFITQTGSCYVNKISKNTGKEYRYYLDEDISREVAKAMNIEYKPKTKSNKDNNNKVEVKSNI